ncbi:MAG: PEP-CTERM sorting domain-containing protein [Verrucomicrobiales bacterium]|jgi:hypothetical protein|nr:PEP-CTERM sorting domain-containing protein [Verrucomicrobiales bacterium]
MKTTINKIKVAAIGMLALTGMLGSLPAQTIMLDFGPTDTAASKLNVAPYVDTVSGTNTWVKLLTTDNASVDTVTVNETGITLNIGLGTASTINFYGEKTIRSNALGSSYSTQSTLFATATPGIDGIFAVDTNPNGPNALGLQISGLEAGSYEIYIVGFNTNSGNNELREKFYFNTTTAWNPNEDIEYSSWESESVAYLRSTLTPATATWEEEADYAKFSFNIGSNEIVSLVAIGTGTADNSPEYRGFFNAIQIVQQIPEPSTWFLLSVGLGTLVLIRRRRR